MSLTKCKECGLMVSSEAKTCPHCGAKKHRSAGERAWFILCYGILAFILLAFLFPALSALFKKDKEWKEALGEQEKTQKGWGRQAEKLLKKLQESGKTDRELTEWITAEAEKYAKKSFEGTPIVFKKIWGVEKVVSSGNYKASVIVDVNELKDRKLIFNIEKTAEGYFIEVDRESWDFLQEEIFIEQIKVSAEKYAKESFKGTSIVYKKIGGVRKESFENNYTVVVEVDIPDANDRVLILEIQRFKDQYTFGWDTRSVAFLALFKMAEAMSE
jgi:hypothetical protein